MSLNYIIMNIFLYYIDMILPYKNHLDEYLYNVHHLIYVIIMYGLMNLLMRILFNRVLELLNDGLFYYGFDILMVLNIMNFMGYGVSCIIRF